MVNHWHLWLSHEEGKEYLYEEAEINDIKTAQDIIKFMNDCMVKMKKRYNIK